MARGDWVVFYSPRTGYPDGPWRRNVDFLDCAETPIRPLLEQLEFVEDKSRWGYKFRFGVFKIGDGDLEVIRSAMTSAK